MGQLAIRVEHLAKRYQIGANRERYRTLRDTLASLASAPARLLKGKQTPDPFIWALNDINFEVHHGEALGIIGRNGAGKSTLLKILSRITRPTRGRVEMYGRVGSLLEVGTGFHPELTGRDNIYLNGAILGMQRSEIERKFDEIVDFAEIEQFLDTPVKRYSSGMYMRLAFAVAAHLEPEILVVDEVLAVGDVKFQKKSLGKMQDVAHSGRTILFVSHHMDAIEALCNRCLLLDHGQVVKEGEPHTVIEAYLEDVKKAGINIRSGNHLLRWIGIENREELNGLRADEDLEFIFVLATGNKDLHNVYFDTQISNEKGEVVVHTIARFLPFYFSVTGNSQIKLRYRIKSPKLAPGKYYLTVYAHSDEGTLLWADSIDACAISPKSYFGEVEFFDVLTSSTIPPFSIAVEEIHAGQ